MLKKVFRFLLVLIGLAVLGLACWLLGLRLGWPLWGVVTLWLGLIIGYFLAKWLVARWTVWRLKRKLASEMPVQVASVDHRALDQQWKAGLRMLGKSGGQSSLPWLLGIDLSPGASDAAADELAVKRLYARPEEQAAGYLNWLFMRRCVLLNLAADASASDRDPDDTRWKRLLYWLLRLKRQEPLNGVVFRIDVGYLLRTEPHELAELGRLARARMDDLARVMDARIPAWVVLTGLEALPGARAWVEHLPEALRDSAFGYTRQDAGPPAGASVFVPQAWQAIQERLEQLRLAQGMRGALPPEVFGFPETVQGLEPRLRALLIPAFDATPYAETTLLQGLYFTYQGRAHEYAFARELYDQVLPAQRDAWMPLERWRTTRRMLRHAAVVAWLVLMAGLLGIQVYAWRDVDEEVSRLSAQPLSALNFEGDLDQDVQSLGIWRDMTLRLYEERQGWHRMLPFEGALKRLATHYQMGFSQVYRREVLEDALDPLIRDSLPIASARGDRREIAAWAQHLVRRINLLKARLAGRSLDGLPLPGNELRVILAQSQETTLGIKGSLLTGQLYRDYLRWEPRNGVLQTELDAMQIALDQLNLGGRSPEWLLSWVDMQGDVQPIRLTDFWNIPYDPAAPEVPAGLTSAGVRAVDGFARELAAATGDAKLWRQRFNEFSVRFRDAGFDAWRQFVAAFPEARKQLPNEGAWKSALASLFSKTDPHVLLLQRIASLFSQLPAQERPAWVAEAIELERIVRVAQSSSAVTGLVDKLSLANLTGSEQVNALAAGQQASVSQGVARVKGALDATSEMQGYRDQIAAAASVLLQGAGSAADFAARTWRFGQDPQVTESPLHTAQQHVHGIWQQLTAQRSADPIILRLLRGQLELTLEYAARAATCSLQDEWESTVLSVPQGVSSPQLANELLYGERGQVQAFLQGRVASFIDRDVLRYRPRETLGMVLPLSGQFFAFASNVQLQQVDRAEQRLREEQMRKAQEAQLLEHQERQAEIEQALTQLRAAPMTVSIESLPPLVNAGGSRGLPRRTRLTLQCANGEQHLDNYNFPVRSQFVWTPDACADVTLSIEFPDFTLVRRYPGREGMFDFLNEFSQGQRTFTRADFPHNADAMMLAGLESLTLSWRIDGYQQALEAGRQLESLNTELAEIRGHIRAARQLAAEAPAQAQTTTDLPAALLPQRVAAPCWQPESRVAPDSGSPFSIRYDSPEVVPAEDSAAADPGADGVPEAQTPTRAQAPGQAAASGQTTQSTPGRKAPGTTHVTADRPGRAGAVPVTPSARSEITGDEPGAPRSSWRMREIPADQLESRTPAVEAPSMPDVTEAPPATSSAGTWSIQVGVYANADKATQVLTTQGIAYRHQPVAAADGKTLTRVVAVGFSSREAAQQAAQQIEAALGSATLLLPPE